MKRGKGFHLLCLSWEVHHERRLHLDAAFEDVQRRWEPRASQTHHVRRAEWSGDRTKLLRFRPTGSGGGPKTLVVLVTSIVLWSSSV